MLKTPVLRIVSGTSTATPAERPGVRESVKAVPATETVSQDKVFVEYLFERYRPALTRFVGQYIKSHEDIDEVLQETFLRVVMTDNLDTLEARARSYLFTIARNLVFDRFRYDQSHARTAHISIDEVELPELSQSPCRAAETGEQLAIVKRCLLSLHARTRQVFLLRLVEHMTLKEIAGALQVSTRTVERDLLCAFALCREKLGAYFHD